MRSYRVSIKHVEIGFIVRAHIYYVRYLHHRLTSSTDRRRRLCFSCHFKINLGRPINIHYSKADFKAAPGNLGKLFEAQYPEIMLTLLVCDVLYQRGKSSTLVGPGGIPTYLNSMI